MFIELHTAGEPRLYSVKHIIEVMPREKGCVVFTQITGVIGNFVDERYEVVKEMLSKFER